jgi:hypothetical protein
MAHCSRRQGRRCSRLPTPPTVLFPSNLPTTYISQPEALVASEACHVAVTTNIRVNTMAGLLEEKYAGGESVIARRRCGGGRPMGLLSVTSV